MADEKVSQYPKRTRLPADTAQIDISGDEAGLDSLSYNYSFLKTAADLIAFADTVDLQTPGVTAATFNCIEKEVAVTLIRVQSVSAAKGIADIQIKIQKNAGNGDVLPLETLTGFVAGNDYFFHVSGSQPLLLSDSDTYNIEVVTGSSGLNTGDFKFYGAHTDVP